MKKIDGAESDDSDARSENSSLLDNLENEIGVESVPDKGIFALKFMQRAVESQRKAVLESISGDPGDLSDEKYVMINSSFKLEHGVGKRVFEHNPVERRKKKTKNIEDFPPDGFNLKASGPVYIKQNGIFEVDSFDDLNSKEMAPIVEKEYRLDSNTKDNCSGLNLKQISDDKLDNDFSESQKSKDGNNPWLDKDAELTVKNSIKVNQQYHKKGKLERSMDKLKNTRNQYLKVPMADFQKLTAKPDFDLDSETNSQSENCQFDNKELMKLAFANDDIALVCTCLTTGFRKGKGENRRNRYWKSN
jgi:U3 small nucleolar RNA-associated protein 14